jgi:transposase
MTPVVNKIKNVLTACRDEPESLRHTVALLSRKIIKLKERLKASCKENSELKRKIKLLKAGLSGKGAPAGEVMVAIPLSEYETLKDENTTLRTENKHLTDKIALMKGSRDSKTSSTSPSQDLGRSNRNSLREPSGKKPGGQVGHTGHHLQQTDKPDEIINHTPAACTCCGNNLEKVVSDSIIRRQEVDIPPISPFYTEHRNHIKICPSCGVKNQGVFPDRIVAPIQYGPVVEATTGYLSVYQYVPYQRIVHFFRDCFKLHLSEGSVDSFLEKLSQKAASFYETIRQQIQAAPVVGSDETGCRVNGKKHWFHVWQNRWLTFIVAFAYRSFQAVEEYFPGGFIHAFLVSDCYAAQLKTPAKAHQLCIAHLLRELLNFEKNLSSKWSGKMKKLLCMAMDLKETMTRDDYQHPPKQVTDINKRLDKLLAVNFTKFHSKEQAFIKRLIKHRTSILNFLAYENVPPTNNSSEQSIRNVKVKTKVSGQFRNKDGKGADRFARIRSVVDTSIKNGQDVYAAFISLANNKTLTAS